MGPVIVILIVIGCVVLTYYVMTGYARRHERAIEALRQRLARGEIGAEEFESRRRALDA